MAIILLGSFDGIAQEKQKNTEQQSFYWIRYYNKLIFNESWQLHTEIDSRRFLTTNRQHQWVLPRIHVHRIFKNGLDVGVGATWFMQAMPQNGETEIDYFGKEIRPHQEVNLKGNIAKLKTSQRLKIEERFFLENEETPAFFVLRLRYRWQMLIPLTDEKAKLPVSMNISDEVMFNAGSKIVYNVFDQNRLYAGFQLKFTDSWSADIGYMNWFQQRASGSDFYNRHIARLTINHSIYLKNH